MSLHVKHSFVSPKADGTDSTLVKPSSWNADHDLTSDEGSFVLGRDTSGPGAVEELPISVTPGGDVSLPNSNGFFLGAVGTTAQRPASPSAGMVRFNTDLQIMEIYASGSWQPMFPQLPSGATVGWYSNAPPVGWLLENGDTIGDASSGATHADPSMVNLFAYLWNNIANAQCAVTPGGRGASAAADWAAHKALQLVDARGAVDVVPDNGKGVFPSSTMGANLGESTHTLTRAEVPSVIGDPELVNAGVAGAVFGSISGGVGTPLSATGSGFGGGAHNNIQVSIVKNRIIKI